MKTKQTKTETTFTTSQVNLITQIQEFMGVSPIIFECCGNVFFPVDVEEGVMIDFEKKEIGFIDAEIDTKTYFAIVGIALSWGYTTEDYFNED